MSRLVNYGLGEVADRLSILSLKIAHGIEQSKSVEHFVQEQGVLQVELRTRGGSTNGWIGLIIDLTVVNARLWQAEDQIRADHRVVGQGYLVDDADRIIRCAFLIADLNDRRAALVRQINQLTGDAAGPEKL